MDLVVINLKDLGYRLAYIDIENNNLIVLSNNDPIFVDWKRERDQRIARELAQQQFERDFVKTIISTVAPIYNKRFLDRVINFLF